MYGIKSQTVVEHVWKSGDILCEAPLKTVSYDPFYPAPICHNAEKVMNSNTESLPLIITFSKGTLVSTDLD